MLVCWSGEGLPSTDNASSPHSFVSVGKVDTAIASEVEGWVSLCSVDLSDEEIDVGCVDYGIVRVLTGFYRICGKGLQSR